MADLEFEVFEGDYDGPMRDGRLERARRIVSMAGAVCSVALVLGLGFWGYQLAVRDVAGIPVMRAIAGPMRIAPADPGGDQASNQGLSVNAIAATGTSSPVAEQLSLAPRPVELLQGDTSGSAAIGAADAAVGLVISGSASPAIPVSLQVADPAPLDEGAGTLIEADTGVAVDLASADSAPLSSFAVARSLRPQPRPAALAASSSLPTNVESVSAPGAATELDPATVTVGTRLAQLGAFDSPEVARVRFSELQVEFGELMAGRAIVIQAAQSGGRTFYRLRALGFDSDDDARRFCAALQAENADCIPVAQR